jgi:hypothetical protein
VIAQAQQVVQKSTREIALSSSEVNLFKRGRGGRGREGGRERRGRGSRSSGEERCQVAHLVCEEREMERRGEGGIQYLWMSAPSIISPDSPLELWVSGIFSTSCPHPYPEGGKREISNQTIVRIAKL